MRQLAPTQRRAKGGALQSESPKGSELWISAILNGTQFTAGCSIDGSVAVSLTVESQLSKEGLYVTLLSLVGQREQFRCYRLICLGC